jgi:hypothetical protein
MNPLQREAYVCKRAYELGASGLHIEPLTVLSALIYEGFPEATDVLATESLRNDLHTLCAQAWNGRVASRHT